jgi:hypothetical protein
MDHIIRDINLQRTGQDYLEALTATASSVYESAKMEGQYEEEIMQLRNSKCREYALWAGGARGYALESGMAVA